MKLEPLRVCPSLRLSNWPYLECSHFSFLKFFFFLGGGGQGRFHGLTAVEIEVGGAAQIDVAIWI